MIESFDNTPNNAPESRKENPEEVRSEREQGADSEEAPEVKQTPEFNESRIDRERLKAAIDIAQAGSTVAEQFKKEKNVYFRDMDESELRNEVRRAEKGGNESKVLELEELILGREKKNNPPSIVEGERNAPSVDSGENPEKKSETNSNESAVQQESLNEEAPQERVGRTGSYSERLSALAKEKDPLGLARVALQETLQELGVTEAVYLKAGPFEQLVAADKLEVVRELEAFKEKTQKNSEISERDYTVHLKGLIYEKIEELPLVLEETVHEQHLDEGNIEKPEEKETSREPAIDQKEVSSSEVLEREQEEVLESDSRLDSFGPEKSVSRKLYELKESVLLENIVRTLRESVYEHLKTAEGYEDPMKIERAMSFFDQQVKNIFSEGKEGIQARGFVSESLKVFLPDSNLSPEEQKPYVKVLDLLSEEKSSGSFDQAA